MPTVLSKTPKRAQSRDYYVGLDIHRKSWTVSIRSGGRLLENFTQPPGAGVLIRHLHKKYPGARFSSAYEAGFCGTSIHEQLWDAGINNIVVNPADVPATDKTKKNKTDLHDSRSICEHLERGNLRGIHVLSREQQELRSFFRFRAMRVKEASRAVNRLKSFLIFFDIDYRSAAPKKTDMMTLRDVKVLQKIKMDTPAGTLALQSYISEVIYQRSELAKITKLLRAHVKSYFHDQYFLLLSVPGIGTITAMGLLAEIGDFSRFKGPDEYCSYLGLYPRSNGSGENNHRTQGLQPRCNRRLRPLLVEASWIAIRKNPALMKYYRKHAIKNPKRAIIKVARKLALIARGVIKNERPFSARYKQRTT